MSRDDIIRMAREADGHKGDECEVCGTTHGLWMFGEEELEDFAAFVAAAERERILAILDDMQAMAGNLHNYYGFAANKIREKSDGVL